MASTYKMLDLEATPIDEERLINVEIEMLKLSLTQLLRHEEEPALRVVRPKVDQLVKLVWDRPPLPLMLSPWQFILSLFPLFKITQ
jgi:hypothetical protein